MSDWTLTGDATRLMLGGSVDFHNFVEVRQRGEELLAEQTRSEVHLGELDSANSTLVALLLAWFRFADRSGESIVFMDVPRDLRNIIEFSGLSGVLPLGSSHVETVTDEDPGVT